MNCRVNVNLINKHIFRMIRDLKLDKTSGASELVEIALEILKTQLDSIKDSQMDITDVIFKLSQELLKVRPSMAPIINTIGYLLHDLEFYTKENLPEGVTLSLSISVVTSGVFETRYRIDGGKW